MKTMNIIDANEIIAFIKSLKTNLIKAQDYNNATIMREMEKEYLDKEVTGRKDDRELDLDGINFDELMKISKDKSSKPDWWKEEDLVDYFGNKIKIGDRATLIKFLEWYLDDGITVYDESEEAVDEFFKQSLQD